MKQTSSALLKRKKHSLIAAKKRAADEGWARWIKNESDELALIHGYRFCERRAEHVRMFGEKYLKLTEGIHAGEPFELMEWQWENIIAPVFGWVGPDPDFGGEKRRFEKAFVFVPKKNGKSPLASLVGLYMLLFDEQGAKVFSGAADREQARIVHNHAVRMVEASDALSSVLDINRTTYTIRYPGKNAEYRALSSDAKKKEGLNGNCMILDELHVVDEKLWDVLRYMFASRKEPLLFMTTTAGDDPLSICRRQYDYAKSVAEGDTIDLTYHPVIYEADPGDDIMDPEVIRKSNPAIGRILSYSRIERDIQEAQGDLAAITSLKRYRFNIWATTTTPWLDHQEWLRNEREMSDEELATIPCWAGLDLAKVHDTTALVLTFELTEDTVFLKPYFFLPRQTAIELNGKVPYLQWEQEGHITLTDGDVCDYDAVLLKAVELFELYNVQEFAFDPWQAEKLTQDIEEQTGVERVEFRQTIVNYASPTSEFERMVKSERMLHDGNPVMTWQAGHVHVKVDASGNMRPVKPAKWDIRKIDGIVGAIEGLSRMPVMQVETDHYVGDGSL